MGDAPRERIRIYEYVKSKYSLIHLAQHNVDVTIGSNRVGRFRAI